MFSGGCDFIDHVSGYVSIKHQVAINANENVKGKLTFEREAQSQGVVIKGYHTDYGIFNSLNFVEELLKKQQKIRFSGSQSIHVCHDTGSNLDLDHISIADNPDCISGVLL